MYSINYDYLRPEKAKMLKQWCGVPLAERSAPEIWQGSHATRQATSFLLTFLSGRSPTAGIIIFNSITGNSLSSVC